MELTIANIAITTLNIILLISCCYDFVKGMDDISTKWEIKAFLWAILNLAMAFVFFMVLLLILDGELLGAN